MSENNMVQSLTVIPSLLYPCITQQQPQTIEDLK